MARITGVRTIALAHALGESRAYGMARGTTAARAATLVVVETDAGVTGLGEAWGPGAAVAAAAAELRSLFVGRRVYDLEQIRARFHDQRYHL